MDIELIEKEQLLDKLLLHLKKKSDLLSSLCDSIKKDVRVFRDADGELVFFIHCVFDCFADFQPCEMYSNVGFAYGLGFTQGPVYVELALPVSEFESVVSRIVGIEHGYFRFVEISVSSRLDGLVTFYEDDLDAYRLVPTRELILC